MTDKPPEPDDPDQFQRFLKMAEHVGAEYDEADFEAKVKAIAQHKVEQKKRGSPSDH